MVRWWFRSIRESLFPALGAPVLAVALGACTPTFRNVLDKAAPLAISNDRFSLAGVPSAVGSASSLGITATQAEPSATARLWVNDPGCTSGASVARTVVDSNGGFEWSAVPLGSDGTKNFFYTLSDRRGNTSPCSSVGLTYVKDTTAPSLVEINRVTPTPTNNGTVAFTVTFSEPITGLTAGQFSTSGSTAPGVAILSLAGSGASYTVSAATGSGSGSLVLRLGASPTAVDAVGLTLLGSTVTATYTLDRDPPAAVAWSFASPAPSPTSSVTSPTFSFSSAESGSLLELFESGICAGAAVASTTVGPSATSGTLSAPVSVDGVHSWRYRATDSLGNQGSCNSTGLSYTLDTTAPTLSSLTRSGASPTASATVSFTVQFSENVSGVDASDFTVASSTVVGATVQSVTPVSASQYTVVAGSGTGTGTLQLGLVTTPSIADAAGNALATTTVNATASIDRTAPSAPAWSMTTPANGSRSQTTSPSLDFTGAEVGSTLAVYETVACTGAAAATITLAGVTTSGSLHPTAGGDTLHSWYYTIADSLGNTTACATTGLSYTLDTTRPAVQSIARNTPSSPTNATSVSFTVVFEESVTGVDTNDFSVSQTGFGASPPTVSSVSGSGTTYTVTVSVPGGISGTVDLVFDSTLGSFSVTDTVGLTANASFSGSDAFVIDRDAPTINLSGPPSNPTYSRISTFTFSGSDTGGAGLASPAYDCNLDGTGFSTCSSGQTYSSMTSGFHNLQIRAKDAAGNYSLITSYDWEVVPPNVTSITGGWGNACATVNGGLRCWGDNTGSVLGVSDGTVPSITSPSPIPGLESGVSKYRSFYRTSCAIVNGGLYCWGDNAAGQLGVGDTTTRTTPTSVPGFTSGVQDVVVNYDTTCALKDGAVSCWGSNANGEVGVGSVSASFPSPQTVIGSNVTAIYASALRTMCADVSGSIKCWGYGGAGRLGTGTTASVSSPTSITGAGSGYQGFADSPFMNHTCALRAGMLDCWGLNSSGQLGDGTTTNASSPLNLKAGGVSVTGILSAAKSSGATCIVQDGAVRCWGGNSSGALGDGSGTSSLTPVSVTGLSSGVTGVFGGTNAFYALMNGAPHAWGDNSYRQIGDGTMTQRNTPVPIPGLSAGVTHVAAAGGSDGGHACAIVGGSLSCWAYNGEYQLGDGTSNWRMVAVQASGVGASSGVSGVAPGYTHTCMIQNGAVKCWGDNASGQLGNGTTVSSASGVAVSGLTSGVSLIASGTDYSCAIQNGSVYCWGKSSTGQLGNGTTTGISSTPVLVSGLSGVRDVKAGGGHTCAATLSGSVQCWGGDGYGEIGNGAASASDGLPHAVTGISAGATQVALGYLHSCALVNGGVKCWGYNLYGQLGDATTTNRDAPVSVGGGLSSGVQQIAAGSKHTCALKNGGVYCWGYNLHGQLGDGTTTNQSTPVAVPGLTNVDAITAGLTHTCALTKGAVKCWGTNLGNGAMDNSTTPVPVKGL